MFQFLELLAHRKCPLFSRLSTRSTLRPFPSSLENHWGYLSVTPAGTKTQTGVSTLNNPTGTVVANAAIVAAGTNGQISVYVSQETNLVIDMNGFFASPSPNGLQFYAMVPCRVYDSRTSPPGEPFSGEQTIDLIWGPCPAVEGARAYALNATVIPAPVVSYLTLWQDDPEDRPLASTLNALDGRITSNMAIVPTQGYMDAFIQGKGHLVLDMYGYFAW